jgi:thiosulfate/3-mercaptopyruvate sulfurtransferase
VYTTLISTDILGSHLQDSWVVVDCRFDLQNDQWGREQYLASHIPGAVYASLSHDMAGPKTGTNGRHPLPSMDALCATLGQLGISSGSQHLRTPAPSHPRTVAPAHPQVIAYDQDSGMYASRLWWLLRYAGHDAVAVLDGGWAKWLREGRPTRSGMETRTPTTFVAAPRPGMRVAVDELVSLVNDPATLLVDARAPERYEGRTEPIDRVPGHIPGAVNHHYKSNALDDSTFLSPDMLRDRFTDLLDGRDPSQAVMYCGSGVTACHNLLAMAHAGLPGARLYPGSWSEWSADPTRPVERGPSSK